MANPLGCCLRQSCSKLYSKEKRGILPTSQGPDDDSRSSERGSPVSWMSLLRHVGQEDCSRRIVSLPWPNQPVLETDVGIFCFLRLKRITHLCRAELACQGQVLDQFLLLSFLSPWHRLASSEKDPPVIKYSHWIGLYASLWGHF